MFAGGCSDAENDSLVGVVSPGADTAGARGLGAGRLWVSSLRGPAAWWWQPLSGALCEGHGVGEGGANRGSGHGAASVAARVEPRYR